MEAGRYPVGVVYLEMPPELVDVNVHPQKAEVRFSEGRALFDAVLKELHPALARAFNVPSIGSSSRGWFTPQPNAQRTGPPPPPPSSSRTPSGELDTLRSLARADKIPTGPPPSMGDAAPRPPSGGELAAAKPYSVEPSTMKSLAEREQAEADAASHEERALFAQQGFYARLRFCSQVRLTFLVCEGEDGLYVLDQHAAAERVTYHRLRRGYGARGVSTQRLLLPEVVELAPAEIGVVEEHAEAIESLGVEVRPVGASAVAVHAVPRILARARPERIVRDLVAELGRAAKRPFNDAADLVLATMACHGSIRAGDAISPEEAAALLRALDEVDFAGHCPHGRPVVTRIAFEDLERRVGR
jgi:DNA mismatch repair protein MutL